MLLLAHSNINQDCPDSRIALGLMTDFELESLVIQTNSLALLFFKEVSCLSDYVFWMTLKSLEEYLLKQTIGMLETYLNPVQTNSGSASGENQT